MEKWGTRLSLLGFGVILYAFWHFLGLAGLLFPVGIMAMLVGADMYKRHKTDNDDGLMDEIDNIVKRRGGPGSWRKIG